MKKSGAQVYYDQSAPLFHGPFLAESKEYRAIFDPKAQSTITSEQEQQRKEYLSMDAPSSPTPFSDGLRSGRLSGRRSGREGEKPPVPRQSN